VEIVAVNKDIVAHGLSIHAVYRASSPYVLAAPLAGVLPLGLAITLLEPLTGGASPLRPHRQRWGGAGLIPSHGCPRPTR